MCSVFESTLQYIIVLWVVMCSAFESRHTTVRHKAKYFKVQGTIEVP